MADFKNYDYFSENREDFYRKFSHKSILCQGKHRKKTPLVTILITTYNRPELLRQAIESALNQKGFDDYQIIIADNEGRPLEEETLTAKVVKNYQDEKVIYYRHAREAMFKADSAVRLAKSPWIVFLHDDDILAENHLAVMTGIIKKHKEIKYLECPMESFTSERELKRKKKTEVYSYTVCRYLRDTFCLGGWVGWLGALISRKHYIAMGGMPMPALQAGDVVMTGKFHYHFGIYGCNSSRPLYYYRRGTQQLTYSHRDKLEINRVEVYSFYKYVIQKCHRLTHRIWERNAAYVTLDEYAKYVNSNIYRVKADVDYIVKECGMPSDIKEKNFRYYMTRNSFGMYRKLIEFWDDIYIKKFRKSDVHIKV